MPPSPFPSPAPPAPSPGPWLSAWQRLRRQPSSMLALAFLILITSLCLLAPPFSPYAESQQNLDTIAQGPSL
ncbi:MAG: hypothetical protein QE274_09335, partial [Verrucomicrobiaceae bacterium]|nr:hypothetical protein [Verrucomicrobiaceae bacterium]